MKTIPPENIGLEGFVSKYTEMSIADKNLHVLGVFPNPFWESLGISFADVSEHADIFCQEESSALESFKNTNNRWLKRYGLSVLLAMQKASIWNEGYMRRGDFKNRCSEIARGELQVLGQHMLSLLPSVEQKVFCEFCYKSVIPKNSLRIWADYTCVPCAENDGIVAPKSGSLRLHLSDAIKEIGFVSTIMWLRGLPTRHNFETHVQNFSGLILEANNLRNYSKFDSVFFPHTSKYEDIIPKTKLETVLGWFFRKKS